MSIPHRTDPTKRPRPKGSLLLFAAVSALGLISSGSCGFGSAGPGKPTEAIVFAGTGCDSSPLPAELQLAGSMKMHFSDAKGKCYDFLINGFPASWQLAGMAIIWPDGTRNDSDPIWQVTGGQVTASRGSAYYPNPSGLVILFASSRNYPAGKWQIFMKDQTGHEVASSFMYP